MFYSSGNYEAFARPRKPEGVERKTAWFVGAGLASLAGAALLSVGMLATFPPRPVASVAMLIVAASTFRLGCMVAIGLALYYALHPHAASLWLAIVGGWFAVSYAEFRTVAPVLNGAGPRPPMMTPQTPPQQNRIPAE